MRSRQHATQPEASLARLCARSRVPATRSANRGDSAPPSATCSPWPPPAPNHVDPAVCPSAQAATRCTEADRREISVNFLADRAEGVRDQTSISQQRSQASAAHTLTTRSTSAASRTSPLSTSRFWMQVTSRLLPEPPRLGVRSLATSAMLCFGQSVAYNSRPGDLDILVATDVAARGLDSERIRHGAISVSQSRVV